MHSAEFATSPGNAGELARQFLSETSPGIYLTEREVMDIDGMSFREDRLSAKLYGYLKAPFLQRMVQSPKDGGCAGERVQLDAIATDKVISASFPQYPRNYRQIMTLNPLRINYPFVTYSGKIVSSFGGPKGPENPERLPRCFLPEVVESPFLHTCRIWIGNHQTFFSIPNSFHTFYCRIGVRMYEKNTPISWGISAVVGDRCCGI